MRLPQSIISLIESHLPIGAENFQKSAKYTLGPLLAPHRTSKPPPAFLRPSPQAGPSSAPAGATRKEISYHISQTLQSHGDNFYPALQLAHGYLHDATLASQKIRSTIARQRLYSNLVDIFANAHIHVAVRSLFNRQLDEGLPPSAACMSSVLESCLASGESTIPILTRLLPLMPAQLDVNLLTLFLRAFIRDVEPDPKDVRNIIEQCLATTPRYSEAAAWPVELYEVLISSHSSRGDFRGAVAVLQQMRAALQKKIESSDQDQDQVQDQNHHQLQNQVRPNFTSSQVRAIRQAYVAVLTLWVSSPDTLRRRKGSLLPQRLAQDLDGLIGSQRFGMIWLNTWFNAERVAENVNVALAVWKAICSAPFENTSRPLAIHNSKHVVAPPGPDATSYTTHFKLSKMLSMEHTRDTTRQLLDSGMTLSIPLLNAAMAAALHHGDLPLTVLLSRLFLLRKQKDNRVKVPLGGLLPANRTIDILAGGLVRLWRKGGSGSGYERVFGKAVRPPVDVEDRVEGVLAAEWDIVSRTLHQLRHSTSDGERERQARQRSELPLSRPIARLEPAPVALDALKGVDTDGEVETHKATYIPYLPDLPKEDYQRPRDRNMKNEAASLMEPMIRLLERALVEEHVDRDWAKGQSREEVLKAIMAPLYLQVWPPKEQKE